MPYDAPAKQPSAKAQKRRFKVDLWATDLNTVEIGIMKDAQNQAQSRQFTRDMEIIGQTVEDGERTGLIGYRKEAWRDGVGMDRRLVIKLFTDKLNWRASLDLMLARSLQLSQGAGGVPVPAFSANVARHDQVIQLERSAYKLPFIPEWFSLFVLNDEGEAQFYTIRRKWISIGADYRVHDQCGRKIGKLDGRVVNLGGAWLVELDEAHAKGPLEHALTLFCAMLRFNRDARNHVKGLADALCEYEGGVKIERQEQDLYMNPRRVR